MYLVDPRISSDPHNLLSIHTSTYLFFARPTQKKVREAWLRDPQRGAVNGINGKMPPPAGLHKKKTARRRGHPESKEEMKN